MRPSSLVDRETQQPARVTCALPFPYRSCWHLDPVTTGRGTYPKCHHVCYPGKEGKNRVRPLCKRNLAGGERGSAWLVPLPLSLLPGVAALLTLP